MQAEVITIEGQPFSKARPRFTGNGGVYSDAKSSGHEELLAWHFKMAFKVPLLGGVRVAVTFFRSNKQRIDLDNLVKAVLDAASGIAFVDDVQVVELGARLELDHTRPRTVVEIAPASTSMPRGSEAAETKDCPTCGKSFESRSYASKPEGQIYCSKECVAGERICPVCEKRFKPATVGRVYCSSSCAEEFQDAQRQAALEEKHSQYPKCLICETRLKHQSALLCKTCWLTKVTKGKSKAEVLAEYQATGKVSQRREGAV